MNNNFILIDKTNNLQKNATAIIKFNFENKDYLVYSIDENEVNKQIFVSKLILNSEGKTFVENILPEEKNKLSNIVYNLIILTPTNFKKGMQPRELLKDIKEKLMVNLSLEIPQLNNQEYFANCSIAITNKEFVEESIKFYMTNLVNEVHNEEITPTWTIPTSEPVAVNNSIVEPPVVNNTIPNVIPNNITGNISVESPAATPIPNPTTIVSEPIPAPIPNMPNVETPSQPVGNQMVQPPEAISQDLNNLPNPQAEKLENIAVVSDPSLSASGVNIQPNLGKQKNAGFTLNKYIVIGTICILLAIVVVIVAYILIQKKINGA